MQWSRADARLLPLVSSRDLPEVSLGARCPVDLIVSSEVTGEHPRVVLPAVFPTGTGSTSVGVRGVQSLPSGG